MLWRNYKPHETPLADMFEVIDRLQQQSSPDNVVYPGKPRMGWIVGTTTPMSHYDTQADPALS